MALKKLRYVEWVDSAGTGRWERMTEHADSPVKTIRTIGWVLRDDKDSLVLAQSVDDLDENFIPMAHNSMCIPRIAIIEERNLSKAGKSRKK